MPRPDLHRPYLQIEAEGRVPVRITVNTQGNGRLYDVLHPSLSSEKWNWDNLSGLTGITEDELLGRFATALRDLRLRPDATRKPIYKISI